MLRDAAAWLSFQGARLWKAAAKACLWLSRFCSDLEEWFATSMTWRDIRATEHGDEE